MATAPSDPRQVLGRIDLAGRLVAADPELELLQRQAGADLGQRLALPQLAAIAQLARELGAAVTRPALIAGCDHDVAVRVRAEPDADGVALILEDWQVRPVEPARLSALLTSRSDDPASPRTYEWAIDEQLRLISVSADLAEALGLALADAIGQPLMRVVRLEEGSEGDMPLMTGIASRSSFSGQAAHARAGNSEKLVLAGDPVVGGDGKFAGFRGTADIADQVPANRTNSAAGMGDAAIDGLLKQPLDNIIASAQRIVTRSEGPLRNDYATYGSDIVSAARHLLSVIDGMSETPAEGHIQDRIDLGALAAEAVLLAEPSAEARGVNLGLERVRALQALGDERATIQILVNLITNAIRYSPAGATVMVTFESTPVTASVTVSDGGPGIAPADQQRIFERFERADTQEGGTGLGLAICRRLARSMGGDVTVESAPGAGARFTLTLPTA